MSDNLIAAVFVGGCLWLIGKGWSWILTQAKKKGALDGYTQW